MKGMTDTRAAFQGLVSGDLSDTVDKAEHIKSTMDGILKTSNLLNRPNLALAGAAVIGTGLVLTAGYLAIESHVQEKETVLDCFENDCLTNSATFFLPEKKRTGSQQFFAALMALLEGADKRASTIVRCAGIQYRDKVIHDKVPGTYYSVVSFFSTPLGAGFDHGQGDDEILERARQGANLFLLSVPSFLEFVHSYVKDHSVESDFTPHKVTNRLNLIRFMEIAFANILASLQHRDLMVAGTIALCDQVGSILDSILVAPKPSGGSIPFIQKKVYDNPLSYIHEVLYQDELMEQLYLFKQSVLDLEAGYRSKLIHELNLDDVISGSRLILKHINTMMTRVVYLNLRHSHPDHLAHLVHRLADAFGDFPRALLTWKAFYPTKCFPVIEGMNNPPSTSLDLIALFSAHGPEDRQKIVTALHAYPNVARPLSLLNHHFIKPLDRYRIIPKNKILVNHSLMEMIAFVMESLAPVIPEHAIQEGIPSIKEQIMAINNRQFSIEIEPSSLALTVEPHHTRPLEIIEKPVIHGLRAGNEYRGLPRGDSLESSGGKAEVLGDVLDYFQWKAETLAEIKQIKKYAGRFLLSLRIVVTLYGYLDKNKNFLLNSDIRMIQIKALKTLQLKRQELLDKVTYASEHTKQRDTESDPERMVHIAHFMGDIVGEENAKKTTLEYRSLALKESLEQNLAVIESPYFVRDEAQKAAAEVDELARAEAAVYSSHDDFQADHERIKGLLLSSLPKPTESKDRRKAALIVNQDNQVSQMLGDPEALSLVVSASSQSTQTELDQTLLIDPPAHVPLDSLDNTGADGVDAAHLEAPSRIAAPLDNPLPNGAAFRLQLLFTIIKAVSAFLLIAGVLVALSLIFAAPYLPIIAALTTQQVSSFTLGSCVSAAAGGMGFAMSYFFKPHVEAPVESQKAQQPDLTVA